jgi:hypothetical protein
MIHAAASSSDMAPAARNTGRISCAVTCAAAGRLGVVVVVVCVVAVVVVALGVEATRVGAATGAGGARIDGDDGGV